MFYVCLKLSAANTTLTWSTGFQSEELGQFWVHRPITWSMMRQIHFYILVCYILYIWAICWQMLVEHIWYLSIWCFTSDLPVVYQWCIVSCTLPMVFFLVCFTGFISHYMSVQILSTLMLCLGHMWPVGRYLHGCDDPRRTVHSPVA